MSWGGVWVVWLRMFMLSCEISPFLLLMSLLLCWGIRVVSARLTATSHWNHSSVFSLCLTAEPWGWWVDVCSVLQCQCRVSSENGQWKWVGLLCSLMGFVLLSRLEQPCLPACINDLRAIQPEVHCISQTTHECTVIEFPGPSYKICLWINWSWNECRVCFYCLLITSGKDVM